MLGERTQQAFAEQAAELLLNPDRSAVGAG
jgi:hypothetical protein